MMEFIQSEERVGTLAEELRGEPLLAVDTEAAGYHRYFDKVCLLQLSTRGRTYVVDTLAVRRLDPLGPLLGDPEVEVVFHDADYDLRLLDRDFGIRAARLFDTKIAAQFLGEPAIGLASLMEKYLDVRLEKRFQRADWAQRPLPADMLAYAAEDTRNLPRLRDRLRELLVEKGRLAWAEEEFRLQEAVQWVPAVDGDAYLRLKGARDLAPRQLAALRELHAWREERARERDVAPFRVISNEALLDTARTLPGTFGELSVVPVMSRGLAQRFGDELLAAVRRARALPESELPVRERGPRRPPPDPALEERIERLRQARDAAAERLGLDRGFLMPRAQLEQIARSAPSTLTALAAVEDLRHWQVAALGEELLKAVAG
jgi:ribonuclease D